MADVLISIAFIILSILVFLGTGKFPELNLNDPGPAFFPKILSVILLILSTALLLSAIKNRKGAFNTKDWKKVLFTLALLLLYYFALDILGFLVSTSLFLIILIKVSGKKEFALRDSCFRRFYRFDLFSIPDFS